MISTDFGNGGGLKSHSPIEILVVEDSATQAEQLKHILEEAGYVVSVAKNGVRLLHFERAQTGNYVSDVNMPEINGYELCRPLGYPGTQGDAGHPFDLAVGTA